MDETGQYQDWPRRFLAMSGERSGLRRTDGYNPLPYVSRRRPEAPGAASFDEQTSRWPDHGA